MLTTPELPEERPRWAPGTAILAIVTGLGAALFAGLVIGIIGVVAGADLSDPPPSVVLISTAAQDVCFIGAAILFAGMHQRPAPWQFGLRPTRVLPAIGTALVLFAVLYAFNQIWASLLDLDANEKLPDDLGVHRSHIALAAAAVLVTTIAPVAEEFLFRGYVFSALRNWRGIWPAALITGVLFGGLHVISSPAGYLVPLALFGVLLCLLYERTGSLYPCIALHSVNNAVAFGASSDIGWSWQIVPVALGALAVISLAAYAVRRAFGVPPALSPI